jgi:integrase/recombinase XerC
MADLVVHRADAELVRDHPARRLVKSFLEGRSASTIKAYSKDLADFATFLGVESTEDAAAQLLAASPGQANEIALNYRNTLLDSRKLVPATVNRRLAALRSLVKLARTLGMVNWNIEIEGVDADPYRDTRGPGNESVRKMRQLLENREDAKGIRDRAILRLLYDRALRRGEVCSLDRKHFDGEQGLHVLGKGRKTREWISLPAATKSALLAWIDVRGDEPGPLFTALDTKNRGHRLTGSAIYAIVRGLGKQIGIKARPHGLRHTAITTALEKTNGNIRTVQAFSRHADPRTVGRYDDNRRDVAGEIADLVSEELDRPSSPPESTR